MIRVYVPGIGFKEYNDDHFTDENEIGTLDIFEKHDKWIVSEDRNNPYIAKVHPTIVASFAKGAWLFWERVD